MARSRGSRRRFGSPPRRSWSSSSSISSLSLIVLPRIDLSFLAKPEWGGTSPAAVTGVWSVIVALTCAILTALALNVRRIPDLRATMDAGVNASALPVLNVASLVGFGAWWRRCRLSRWCATLCSESAGARGVTGGRDQRSGRAYGFGLGRPDDRARRARLDLHGTRRADRHGPGAAPPCRGDQLRDPRQPAAQRRGRNAAGGMRLELTPRRTRTCSSSRSAAP